jgi:hypothetical protein
MDHKMKEAADVEPEEGRSSEKRLARGLEDVSHLFLSQPSSMPPNKSQDQKDSPQSLPPDSARPKIAIPLRSCTTVDRDLLISFLKKNAGVLEEGLRAIDTGVPCNPYGTIDLLALDRWNQLCLINVDTDPNDHSLLRGIGCVEWIACNASVVERMYTGQAIDFAAPSRLLLVAPGFSSLLECALHRIKDPKIYCFKYRAAAIADSAGILFEKV